MKSDLSYLPVNKQEELAQVVFTIKKTVPAEMIILFGSYARNDWVEEKYDSSHYRYQSDFDVLVVVETRSESKQAHFERELDEALENEPQITTPISVIVHDIEFVNRRLSKAQYFFTDIKKEGVLLYDSRRFELKASRELSREERRRIAEEDFQYWFESAEDFYDGFKFYFSEMKYNQAAFLLHQVTERIYSGILLVFTRYKPNTHDLAVLRKLANSVDTKLLRIFPLDNANDRQLFKLLRKAYVDARYKRSYKITKEELLQLSRRVEELKEIGNLLCAEKISSFTGDTGSHEI